ncbi:hypothetical protein [Paracoccus aminovorans]|uniref:hypothetical protein n=1 Tax=Paracoccus aminovorans TaxID=34004 RepID=UPI002B261F5D|nr:hypothetical protein [Paracoccus aminovorans]
MDEAPSEHVVTMESAALRQMADVLGELARDLPSIDPVKNPDIFEGFRALISRVIVHDREDGSHVRAHRGYRAFGLGGSARIFGSGGGI